MIMLTGIAVLGVLAGSMASFFRIDPKEPESAVEGDLATEVAALRAEVARLADAVAKNSPS
jgi:hypothetical protein